MASKFNYDYCCHIEVDGKKLDEYVLRSKQYRKSEWLYHNQVPGNVGYSIGIKFPPGYNWGKSTCINVRVFVDGVEIDRLCHLKPPSDHADAGLWRGYIIDKAYLRLPSVRTGPDSGRWTEAAMAFSPIAGHKTGDRSDIMESELGQIRVEFKDCEHHVLQSEDEQSSGAINSILPKVRTTYRDGNVTHITSYLHETEVRDLSRASRCKPVGHKRTIKLVYRSAEVVSRLKPDLETHVCHCPDGLTDYSHGWKRMLAQHKAASIDTAEIV